AGVARVLEEIAVDHAPIEVGVAEEVIVDAVVLTRTRRTRCCRHGQLELGNPLQQCANQRALADPGRAGDHEDAGTHYRRSMETSSVRWRCERPPIVLEGEIRHSCRTLLTFTRPYLGTASSMSKTFAVSTNSGGSSRRSWIFARPPLRSRLSCARFVR